ncbi:MAG: alpha/beta hydrolase [Bacteroidota bacterium]
MPRLSPSSVATLSLPFAEGMITGKLLGEGPNLLLCLHGFRQNQDAFDRVWTKLPDGWQVLVLNLPPFGESKLSGQGEAVWRAWAETLRTHFPDKTWHLMGYSMGGKLALLLQQWQLFPLKSVCLIAPDGIRSHPIQEWAMYSRLGKWVFAQSLRMPRLIRWTVKQLYRMRLLDRFLYRMMDANYRTEANRQQLKRATELYSQERLNLSRLFAQTQELPVLLIFGKQDPLFPRKAAQSFVDALPEGKLLLTDTGHELLTKHGELVRSEWQAWITTLFP